MFAREPESKGYSEQDGVKTYYEIYGEGDTTLLFIPAWAIAGRDCWRMQVPFLSRYFRCIVCDPRGNGLSDSPSGATNYAEEEYAKDYLAVLEHTNTQKCVIVTASWGANPSLYMAATHPEKIMGVAYCVPALNVEESYSSRRKDITAPRVADPEDWEKYNAEYWKDDYEGFVDWFKCEVNSDPHSTKGTELYYEWCRRTGPQVLLDTVLGRTYTPKRVRELCSQVSTPSLVMGADGDKIVAPTSTSVFASLLGAQQIVFEDGGHNAFSRFPIPHNEAIKKFVDEIVPSKPDTSRKLHWRRNLARPKRVLYMSSPIGLGHARRDAAIAKQLRNVVPGVEIDWLTQPPTDRILEPLGEHLLPQCKQLISETGHFDGSSSDHCQPLLPILRGMDEIMANNFHVFMEVVREKEYDLVISDESWEVDYYLYEHPEYKRFPFIWATDVIGTLPTTFPGEPYNPNDRYPEKYDHKYDREMSRDYNEEMLTRIARFPQVRDLAVFIGDKEDIPDLSFGEGLETIRDHAYSHYEFSGYVLGYDPDEQRKNREEMRAELGYGPDEKICIVCTGGMATGHDLLRKIVQGFPEAKERVPELRMIVVAGPLIDPSSLYDGKIPEGLEIKGFVKDLWRNQSVCDLAVVHGGLTMAMDLTAFNVPFISVPYLRQFEQEVWVRTRIENYGAGHYLDYRKLRGEDGPYILGCTIAEQITRPRRLYKPVVDHALSTARRFAEFL